jgi:transposase
MAKHFNLDITDTSFSFTSKAAEIAAGAAIDCIYVVRTSLPVETCDDATTVRSYNSLAVVERAFRCIKTVDLQVRPVYRWLAGRVRAHVLLCMLAYYLEWHIVRASRRCCSRTTDKQAAEALRTSVVAQAQRSLAAVQ